MLLLRYSDDDDDDDDGGGDGDGDDDDMHCKLGLFWSVKAVLLAAVNATSGLLCDSRN